jgi:hypothetical protein
MAMKLFKFSFKNEAMWTMIFAFAPALIGIGIMLLVYLVRP